MCSHKKFEWTNVIFSNHLQVLPSRWLIALKPSINQQYVWWSRWTASFVHVFYILLFTLGFRLSCTTKHRSYLSWIVFWGFCWLTAERRLLTGLAFRHRKLSAALYTSCNNFIANDTVKSKFYEESQLYYDLSLGLSIIVNRTKQWKDCSCVWAPNKYHEEWDLQLSPTTR